jgi:diphthine synthase
MTLYLIGLGLNDEKDISLKGLEAVKSCTKLYLENYTSILQCSKEQLEELYNKSITLANREWIENSSQQILNLAKENNVAILIVGDPFSATTHINYIVEAKKQNIQVEIIHNTSILNAVGITGLQLYKFGKTTSIPFTDDQAQLETPYNVIKENKKANLHTLILLDLKPEENRFMTINEAIKTLLKIEQKKKEKIVTENTKIIGTARLGSNNQTIRTGTVQKLKDIDFGKPPHCLILPAKLHFMEQDALELWE